MREHFGYTQVQLAERVGKTREHIANISRLLKTSRKCPTNGSEQ